MTIFDKIIAGQIPCSKVYEDAHVFAFLDNSPLSEGHTLVVPRQARAHLHELDAEVGAALGRALVVISRAIVAATGCGEYNVLQNNGATAHQAVMHVHFHIIPKPSSASGLGISWPAGKLEPAKAAVLAGQIAAAIAP